MLRIFWLSGTLILLFYICATGPNIASTAKSIKGDSQGLATKLTLRSHNSAL